MFFVKTYAKVSLAVAALLAIYGCLGLQKPQNGSSFEAVIMMVSTLWMVVSLVACLMFPARTRRWAPAFFVVFCLANLVLTVVLAMSLSSIHPPGWIVSLKQSPRPIYIGMLISAGVFAVLNAMLLFSKPSHLKLVKE
jgi:hypothetical protein